MNISLLSSNGTDYDRLQKLLVNQKWGEADDETYRLMQQASGRGNHVLLNNNNIKVFPCEDLRILNDLWLKNSNSRFGFTVQSQIWRTLSTPETIQDNSVTDKIKYLDRYKEFQYRFAVEVGWKKEGKQIHWRPETKLEARKITSIPRGYYPCKILVCRSWECQLVHWNILFERLDYCVNRTS